MRLQRVESMELVEFPDTMEGLFGKVRWWACPHADLRAGCLARFICHASVLPAERKSERAVRHSMHVCYVLVVAVMCLQQLDLKSRSQCCLSPM